MNFAEPDNFVWLWLLPLVAGILWLGARFRLRRLSKFSSSRLKEILTIELSKSRGAFKSILLLVSLTLIVVALSRPRLGFEWRDLPQGGVDIMVVLDISQSMNAQDLNPSRLSRAKRELIDLLNMMEGDRLGIIGFGGVPFVQCPLTSDYRLARAFINQLNTDLMPIQGTAIGDAIRMAVDRLTKASSSSSEGKAIVLITDGEDHDSDPMGAAELAKSKGVKIFTIGIGSIEGSPIPEKGGGFKKDRKGNVVISKLEESSLRDIALATSGTYVRSVTGDMDLDSIYRNGIRSNVDDQSFGLTRQRVWFERFQWFLGFAVLLLILEFFLKDYRQKKGSKETVAAKVKTTNNLGLKSPTGKTLLSMIPFVLFLGLLIPVPIANAESISVIEAEEAFDEKDYDKATKGFVEAEIKNPEKAVNPYNRAISQFQNGNYDEAVEGFGKAAAIEDKQFTQNSYYNAGNALVAKGDLEKANESYKKALALNPKDKQARENMSWVTKQIQKKKQQKQKGDKNKDDKNKDDEKSEDSDDSEKSDKKQDQDENENKDDKESDEKKQNDKDQESEKEEQDKKDSEKKEEDKTEEEKAADKAKEEEEKKAKEEKKAEDEKNDGEGKEGSPPKPSDLKEELMSEEDAKALLESFEQEGSELLPKPQFTRPKNPQKKDW